MLDELWADPNIQAAIKTFITGLLPILAAAAYFFARKLGLDVAERKDARSQRNAELAALFAEEVQSRLKLSGSQQPQRLSGDELERIAVDKFRNLQPKALGVFRASERGAAERVVAALPTLGVGAAAKANNGPKAQPRS